MSEANKRAQIAYLQSLVVSYRNALENSNSLLAAMLHEKRPDAEIEAQIHENRAALTSASSQNRGAQ